MTTEVKRIKCAHCKDYHGSIDEVKECARVHNAARVFDVPVKMVAAPANHDDVVAGRYAVRDKGIVKFYVVDRPTEGRWAGRVFVKRQVSDDLIPLKTWTSREVLDKIAQDPQGAMLLYGEELGVCGICGRTLTNEESRRDKIGPICRQKFAWWFMGAQS